MSYIKQDFKNGDVLYAADLNEMDDVIKATDDALELKTPEPFRRELVPYKDEPYYIYHVTNKKKYGPGADKACKFYKITNATKYYVSGHSSSNAAAYPLGAWYDEAGEYISSFGTDANREYTNLEVTPPANAKTFVLNAAAYGSTVKAEALQNSCGSESLDNIAVDVENLGIRVGILEGTEDVPEVVKGSTLVPTDTVQGYIYNISNKSTWQSGNGEYQWFDVKGGNWYFVSGASASNGFSYSLCGFFDDQGAVVSREGTDGNTVYVDKLVQAPLNAATMVVNKARGDATIKAINGVVQKEDEHDYKLNIADALIREAKKNPFAFAPLDKGYVTFVVDDLLTDLDSIASIFEMMEYPFCVAAIPDRLDVQATYLKEKRGNFTPGMLMRDIMALVVKNGGEIMTHNSSPVVTVYNQDDYDFMYGHFVGSKSKLEAAGFSVRGLIRAGGEGVISGTTQIERWLIGNYDYSNQGTALNYSQDRTTIQKSVSAIKAEIQDAYNQHVWLKYMVHGYDFGEGQTFTGEEDLIEILGYCKTLGIPVITYSTMFDNFGSSVLLEHIRQGNL